MEHEFFTSKFSPIEVRLIIKNKEKMHMNPIKWTIFYLVLEMVLFFWLKVLMILYKEKQVKFLYVFIITFNLIFILLLSFQIPYSVYWWLMNYWRW